MFRFTIRDLLWLMAVVGLAFGWFVHVQLVQSKIRQHDAACAEILKHEVELLDWYRDSHELMRTKLKSYEPNQPYPPGP
jgi:hypothetical protein